MNKSKQLFWGLTLMVLTITSCSKDESNSGTNNSSVTIVPANAMIINGKTCSDLTGSCYEDTATQTTRVVGMQLTGDHYNIIVMLYGMGLSSGTYRAKSPSEPAGVGKCSVVAAKGIGTSVSETYSMDSGQVVTFTKSGAKYNVTFSKQTFTMYQGPNVGGTYSLSANVGCN